MGSSCGSARPPGPISPPACRSPRSSPSVGPRRRPPSLPRAARSAIRSPPTACRPRSSPTSDSPRWAEIAERCLACANCTLVCPTCFCTSVGQRSDLDGQESVAERTWDSCFTAGFARVAGGNFRPRPQDRYRQWLTHKFATWWDQFGTLRLRRLRPLRHLVPGRDRRPRGALAIAAAAGADAAARSAAPTPTPSPARRRPRCRPGRPLIGLRRPAPPSRVHRQGRATRPNADARSRLTDVDPALVAGPPGQFVMAALPAFSAAPISVSRYRPDGIELTIRAAGPATTAITRLAPRRPARAARPAGPRLAGRGGARVTTSSIVTGGIGLAPAAPAHRRDPAPSATGSAPSGSSTARGRPRDQLYRRRARRLGPRGRPRGRPDRRPRRARVVRAGRRRHPPVRPGDLGRRDTVAFVCGPERMMQATVETLGDAGSPPERICVTLERHMECGVGLCGHCQMGRYFVCRDGPVFSRSPSSARRFDAEGS